MSSDNSLTNVKELYQETGIIFTKDPAEIYRILHLHLLDEDLKVKVESGEWHYRKVIREQTNRKPLMEPKPIKHKRYITKLS